MTEPPKIDKQREHQANERTFLAWLRTSISLIAFGIAIARFGLFLRELHSTIVQQPEPNHPILNSENLGISLVVFGVLTIAAAAWRYNQVLWQIERGEYRPARFLIWIVTAIALLLGAMSIPLLVLHKQELTHPSRVLK